METGVLRARRAALGLALLAALLLAAQAGARQASANLLRNGDGEADAGATSDAQVVSPSVWQTTGTFTVARYGTQGLPSSQSDGGTNLFAGGPGAASSTATQTVDVSASAVAIDAGTARATLSALLGGWETQEDAATVQAVFLDSSGGTLGSFAIGPVTASDRGGKTVLLPRSNSTTIPPKTRAIRVVVTAQRASGIYNDGYADNVSLSLGAAPPVQGRYAFGLRIADTSSDLSAGTHGTFVTQGQPDSIGAVTVTKVSAKDLRLSWRTSGGRYLVVFRVGNGGLYAPDRSFLSLRLAIKSSNVPRCGKGTAGYFTLNKLGDVTLSFCRHRIEFMAPSRSTGWVAQR